MSHSGFSIVQLGAGYAVETDSVLMKELVQGTVDAYECALMLVDPSSLGHLSQRVYTVAFLFREVEVL